MGHGSRDAPRVSTFSTERSFLERAAQLACCPLGAVAGGARRAERTREVDDPQVTFLLSRGGKHDAAVGRAVPSGEAERVGQIVRRRLRRPVIRGRQRSSKVIRGHQRSSEVIRADCPTEALGKCVRRPVGQGRGRPGRRTVEARVSTDQNAAPPRALAAMWGDRGDRWEIDGRSVG